MILLLFARFHTSLAVEAMEQAGETGRLGCVTVNTGTGGESGESVINNKNGTKFTNSMLISPSGILKHSPALSEDLPPTFSQYEAISNLSVPLFIVKCIFWSWAIVLSDSLVTVSR